MFSVQPYATIGFNILRAKIHISQGTQTTYDTQIDLGLSTGFGIEALIKDKFALALNIERHPTSLK